MTPNILLAKTMMDYLHLYGTIIYSFIWGEKMIICETFLCFSFSIVLLFSTRTCWGVLIISCLKVPAVDCLKLSAHFITSRSYVFIRNSFLMARASVSLYPAHQISKGRNSLKKYASSDTSLSKKAEERKSGNR